MKKLLLELYAQAIDSGISEYIELYNKTLVKVVKKALLQKDDSVFRDVAIETEYETQFNAMVQIRKDLFNYDSEETESLIYAM